MSWLSHHADKVFSGLNNLADAVAKPLPDQYRNGVKRGLVYSAAALGGGMGVQYVYSRNQGMNSSEATGNALSGGFTYQQSRADQAKRGMRDNQQLVDAALAIEQEQNARKFSLQDALLTYRRVAGRGRSTRNGTMLTGGAGTGVPMLGGPLTSTPGAGVLLGQ